MTHKHTSENLAKGFQRVTPLPSTNLEQLWQSIVIEESLKDQLVSQAVFNFTVRPKVPRSVLPLHGVILLYGVPGTGKTSLARGLASKTAEFFPKQKFKLIEVNPHQLTSAMMGQSQKAVSELFSQSILEAAIGGPTIVLLDEVETLAVERTKLSLEANPIDAHRATDAVLVQLDSLADQNTNLLFVATSNFPQAVDSAFVSRCDFLAEIPLPDERACADIIAKCLAGLAESFPPWESSHLLQMSPSSQQSSQGSTEGPFERRFLAASPSGERWPLHPSYSRSTTFLSRRSEHSRLSNDGDICNGCDRNQ